METNVSKISLLWVVIMVGFAMHMLADLLPLCWGANVAMPDATGQAPMGMLVFMISIAFAVPMCGLLCQHYRSRKSMRVANMVLASIMLLFCVLHMAELLEEFSPVQAIILVLMVIASLFLFILSRRALK
ncbi:MAG: hypothetical protein IKI28_05845 [Bacteroidales bacterium]|nr:hypothetical protein [Bacteroidales bacterium]